MQISRFILESCFLERQIQVPLWRASKQFNLKKNSEQEQTAKKISNKPFSSNLFLILYQIESRKN